MSDFQYKRAPITGAVIGIRSNSPEDEKKTGKAFKDLKNIYADFKPIPHRNIELKIETEGDPRTKITEVMHYQFSSVDMTQQLQIAPNMFTVTQLAPYEGWDIFNRRFIRDWCIWRKHVGFQEIQRVGMRYINRIDIPITGPILYYEDYITVYPTLPKILDPSSFHAVNVRVNLDDINSVLNLKSALVESPLPNHLAIVIDLDISKEFTEALSDDYLYSYINEARVKKNDIFEACITDKARELFGK